MLGTPFTGARLLTYQAVYILVVAFLAAIVFSIFVQRPGINGYNRAMFPDMIYGRAYKPFVGRALAPATVRLIVTALPAPAKAALADLFSENLLIQRQLAA